MLCTPIVVPVVTIVCSAMLGLRVGVAVCSFNVVLTAIVWHGCLLKHYWLHAPGARPRRHDAAFVVRYTLMLVSSWLLSWIGPKSRAIQNALGHIVEVVM